MHLVKLVTLILLIVLIFMVALTVKRLGETDAIKINNLCKNGISIPVEAGSIVNSGSIKIPASDETYTIRLDCA